MLFVSHATADDERVNTLCQQLHDVGIKTWVDHQIAPDSGLRVGGEWQRTIQAAVNDCEAGLFILTPASAESRYCEAEWTRILALEKILYIALLDSVSLRDFPLRLGIIQYANLVKNREAGLRALTIGITGKIPLDPVAPAVQSGKRVTQNYDNRYSTYSIPMRGRNDDLKKALDDLKQAPLFIVGVGGLGKSRLAAEIVQVGDHTGAIWARVSETSTPEEVIRLVREHYSLEATMPPEKVIERVRQDGQRLLVVIDNAEAISDDKRPEFEKLADQLTLARAAVIVTTRVMDWTIPRRKRSRNLLPLKPEDGAQVVKAMVEDFGIKRDTAPFAESFAQAAYFNPRLIELAVSKLNYEMPDEILEELRTLSSDVDEALSEMIRKTAEQMETRSPGAKAMLQRLAVCRGGFTREAAQVINGLDYNILRNRLKTLIDYHFIRFEDERYSIDDLTRLALGEDATARPVHFDYYKAHAQTISGNLTKHDRYQMLDIESENLDSAFNWVLPLSSAAAFWFAEDCREFLTNRGRFADLMTWFSALEYRLASITDERTRAAFYNSLGLVYDSYPSGVRVDNLHRALNAHKKALRFWKPNNEPLEYATVENNLGNAYRHLAGVENKAVNLRLALKAYREALRFRTKEAHPYNYAVSQNGLGATYGDLAALGDAVTNLYEAKKAYYEVLDFHTSEADPIGFARTQHNLGLIYHKLARIEERENNLVLAIDAYHQSLRFYTAEAAPLEYAMTQRDLGVSLQDSGNLDAAIDCWRAAEPYYRATGYLNEAGLMHSAIEKGEAWLRGDSAP